MNRITLEVKETTGKMIPRKPKLYFYTGDSFKYFKDKRTAIFRAHGLSEEYSFLSAEALFIHNEISAFKNDLMLLTGVDESITSGEMIGINKLLEQALDYYKKSVIKDSQIKAPAKWLEACYQKLSESCLKVSELEEKRNDTLVRYKLKSIHVRCLSGLFHIEFLKNDMFDGIGEIVNNQPSVEN